MDRFELTKMLISCREKEGISKNEMCRRTGLTFSQLQRFENSIHNYSVLLAIKYAKAIGYRIFLSIKKQDIVIYDKPSIARAISYDIKRKKLTKYKISKDTGIQPVTIRRMLDEEAGVSIDPYLILISYFGYTIKIDKPKETFSI